jgi:hypothetical protein
MHFIHHFLTMLLGIFAIAAFLVMTPFFGLKASFLIVGMLTFSVYVLFLRAPK